MGHSDIRSYENKSDFFSFLKKGELASEKHTQDTITDENFKTVVPRFSSL